MQLYDENKNLVELNTSNYFGGGICKIYKDNNDMIKVFPKNVSMDKKTFDLLRDINEDCFINLKDCFYKKETHINVDAYIYDYIEDVSMNILENIDYFSNSINELEKLFNLFNELCIITADIKPQNTICTSNQIVLIDPDFYLSAANREYLYYNIDNLKRLIIMIIRRELKNIKPENARKYITLCNEIKNTRSNFASIITKTLR